MSRFTVVKRLAQESLDEALSLLFQTSCIYCGGFAKGGSLCSDCASFPKLTPPWCEQCGTPCSANMESCGVCRQQLKSPLYQVRSLWWLTPAAKQLMHRIKYQGQRECLEFWSGEAGIMTTRLFGDISAIVPVPLHTRRWLQRGFNQSELLSGWWNRELISQGLVKAKETLPQSTLNRKARLKNLRSSFAWNPKVPVPESVVLIDDIYTTGSTLEACAKVLRAKGCKRVCAWTLFRTPDRSQRPF